MAISFSVSYSFSPNTVISSSNVNTNFTDNANVWTGIEAGTKSFSLLKMDAVPTTALAVATKSYVDRLMAYRRPVLQYSSATVIIVETGLDGTSGDCTILFPDGDLRTDTTTGRIRCNLAQVAALSGSWQSGLRTGAAAANTWYSIYAVKTSDNSSHWVAVADTVVPTQANFATLNSNFGTSSWVYLGVVPYGDNAGATTTVPTFMMAGNWTLFTNNCAGTGASQGVQLTTGSAATSVTYTYSGGNTAGKIPTHLKFGIYSVGKTYDAAGKGARFLNAGGSIQFGHMLDSGESVTSVWRGVLEFGGGIQAADLNSGSGNDWSVYISGFCDPVLGVGANPVL